MLWKQYLTKAEISYLIIIVIVMPLKLCYQVTYSHTGAFIRTSGFPYFQLQLEFWTKVDVMSLREVAALGKSHTECFLLPCDF